MNAPISVVYNNSRVYRVARMELTERTYSHGWSCYYAHKVLPFDIALAAVEIAPMPAVLRTFEWRWRATIQAVQIHSVLRFERRSRQISMSGRQSN
jgi:hypothetical protein